MPLTIIIHNGSLQSQFLLRPLSILREQIQPQELCCPDIFRRWDFAETLSAAAFFQSLPTGGPTRATWPADAATARVLCLNSPQHLHLYHEALWQAKAYLADLFPDARQRIFFSIARQDRDVDALCAGAPFYAGNCSTELMKQWYLNIVPPYAHRLRELYTVFGKDAVTLCVDDETPAGRRSILRTFLRDADIDADDLVASVPNADFVSFDRTLPREFLAFSAAHTGAFPPHNDLKVLPWSTQARLFTPESGFVGDRHSLLSPKQRTEILQHYTPSNAALAKELGMERLFSDPTPEPDWEPFPGLTPETAFKVAGRLDRNFAEARMAELDDLPRQYHTRELHTCRQALHDVLGNAFVAPPFFSRPTPKLSVLTLTYNHASYIEANIKSVIAQNTNVPIQHIIADDGSDDGTQDIVLSYADKYPHIVPVFQRQRSYGPANIRALFEAARSPYVALCDGDDYFTDPNKLQIQMDFLDAHPDCALCFHQVRVTYEDDPSRERLYPPLEEMPRGVRQFYYLSDLIKCNLIQTNSAMYRWRFKDGVPTWFRPDLFPGDWYWHLLHAEKGKIGFINKVMSVYRRQSASAYYLTEVNRLQHRHTVGLQELEAYDVVNMHFKRRFEPIIRDLANGVLADCLLYSNEIDDESVFFGIVDKYPYFAKHFLDSLKIVSAKKQ